MKISFDLDQTLIPFENEFETENRNLFQKIAHVEPIRKGTTTLMRELQNSGHEIIIYTSSSRNPASVWFNFRTYGISIKEVITAEKTAPITHRLKIGASKYPPAFGIDLHVDDSLGIRTEGQRYGYPTIIVQPQDPNWCDTILQEIKRY